MQERIRKSGNEQACQISAFALRTLGLLAVDRPDAAPETLQAMLESYCAALHDAVLAPDPAGVDRVTAEMQRALISPAAIAECYVPEIARRLGEGWIADRLNFAAVSIGSARLQGLLRRLGPIWHETVAAHDSARPAYLIAVPHGCQHTLGASVLAGQLRNRGLNVLLGLDQKPDQLRRIVSSHRFSTVLISASRHESLDSLIEMVQNARYADPDISVIVGGNILDQMQDLQLKTGADLATSDLDKALSFCGASRTTQTRRVA